MVFERWYIISGAEQVTGYLVGCLLSKGRMDARRDRRHTRLERRDARQ
jgi:hypothetical protein